MNESTNQTISEPTNQKRRKQQLNAHLGYSSLWTGTKTRQDQVVLGGVTMILFASRTSDLLLICLEAACEFQTH